MGRGMRHGAVARALQGCGCQEGEDGDGERSCLCPALPSSTGASTEVGSSPQILGGLHRLCWVSLDVGQGCGMGAAASLGPGHPGEVGALFPVPLCLIR